MPVADPPAPPPPERHGQPTTSEPPPAVKTSVSIIWAAARDPPCAGEPTGARIVLTVPADLGIAVVLFSLVARGQPVIFLIINLVTLALYAALLYFMWQQESTAYLTAPKPH